jgi:hypothetical protein
MSRNGLQAGLVPLKADAGQPLNRPGCVDELEVGVGVHRQTDVAVTHQLLRHSRHHAGLAEQRGEGMPKAMDVDRLAIGGMTDPTLEQVRIIIV